MRTQLFVLWLIFCSLLSACKYSQRHRVLQWYSNGFFPNEVKPNELSVCFQGAYYRKLVTSKDCWTGIVGQVVLPTICLDSTRVNLNKPLQYMDNSSVYLGGQSNGQETDIGLIWEVIRDADGTVSKDRRAFRPFLRRASCEATGQQAHYMNAPAQEQYYWAQGDTVVMSLKLVGDKKLLFTVEGMGKKYETTYDCDGYTYHSPIEFKRVNAIDQVANEGKHVAKSKTKIKNSTWLYTKLYRTYNDKEVLVPLHKGRATDMRCPDIKVIEVKTTDELSAQGGEVIVIDAGKYDSL